MQIFFVVWLTWKFAVCSVYYLGWCLFAAWTRGGGKDTSFTALVRTSLFQANVCCVQVPPVSGPFYLEIRNVTSLLLKRWIHFILEGSGRLIVQTLVVYLK